MTIEHKPEAGRRLNYSDLLGIFRRIISGELEIRADEGKGTWEKAFAGDVDFTTSEGHKLRFFNDCDELDYLDSAKFPDGCEWDFDYDTEPTRMLEPSEFDRLEGIISQA